MERVIIWMLTLTLVTLWAVTVFIPRTTAQEPDAVPLERVHFRIERPDGSMSSKVVWKDYLPEVARRIEGGAKIQVDDGRVYLIKPWTDYTSKHWDCAGIDAYIDRDCDGQWIKGFFPILRIE